MINRKEKTLSKKKKKKWNVFIKTKESAMTIILAKLEEISEAN